MIERIAGAVLYGIIWGIVIAILAWLISILTPFVSIDYYKVGLVGGVIAGILIFLRGDGPYPWQR